MPWKEYSVTDNRLRFVSRRLAGEAMARVFILLAAPHQMARKRVQWAYNETKWK